MKRRVSLQIGQALRTRSGVGQCRVGAVVLDKDGRALALTARHPLWADPEATVLDAASGQAIGARLELSPAALTDAASPPFHTTIGAVLLDGDIDYTEALTTPAAGAYATVEDLRDKTIVSVGAGDAASGVVVGVGSVRFLDPFSDNRVRMSDAIEIRVDCGDPFQRGEAGLLFVDQLGAAVGLLISSGKPGHGYLAPLAKLLTINGLKFAGDSALPLSLDNGGADFVLLLEAQLDRLGETSAVMRRALEAEPSMHRDPSGQRVPEKLMALLD